MKSSIVNQQTCCIISCPLADRVTNSYSVEAVEEIGWSTSKQRGMTAFPERCAIEPLISKAEGRMRLVSPLVHVMFMPNDDSGDSARGTNGPESRIISC